MPADFSIVLGEEYQDVAATPRDIKFWMPENAVIQRANAILQLMVYPRLDPDDLKVEVSINGTTVLTYGPSSADFVRSFHVVFNAANLMHGDNFLRVKRTSGDGSGAFRLYNVVVWYREGVTAASKTALDRTARKTKTRPTTRKSNKRPTKGR